MSGAASDAASAGEPLVFVRGLKKYFPIRGGVTGRTVGLVRAVDGVDLTIERGKTLGLIGESGCGKTTVGRTLLRLLEPTEGTVRFAGKDVVREAASLQMRLAGALLVAAAAAGILTMLVGILSKNTAQAIGLPDIVLMIFGVVAPGSTAGFSGGTSAFGANWILVGLFGIVACTVAAGTTFEAKRFRNSLIATQVALLSGQFVLVGAALVLVVLSRKEFSKDTAHSLRKDMQIVFQDPFGSLNPRLLVSKTVSEPLRAFRDELSERYPEAERGAGGNLTESAMHKITSDLIARVGLNPEHLNRFPHEFSGGQRQRICVARALALKPAFIVLDEPTSALDVSVQAQILNMMKELQRERGLTFLFISHHLAVIRHMCDDVAVMYLGKIVEQAGNQALFRAPMHPYTLALLSAVPSVDPETRRERIVLEGEIPSPANPPSGCRFHTRCNFALERETREEEAVWADGELPVVELRDPLAAPGTVRLVVGGAVIDPLAALGSVAYDVREAGGGGHDIHVQAKVKRGAGVRVRYRRYRESCATVEPPLAEAEPGHRVACHFWKEVVAAQDKAQADKRPVGAVIAEARAALPPLAAGP